MSKPLLTNDLLDHTLSVLVRCGPALIGSLYTIEHWSWFALTCKALCFLLAMYSNGEIHYNLNSLDVMAHLWVSLLSFLPYNLASIWICPYWAFLTGYYISWITLQVELHLLHSYLNSCKIIHLAALDRPFFCGATFLCQFDHNLHTCLSCAVFLILCGAS